MEGAEVVSLLEGGWAGWRAAGEAMAALWGAVREPWLARALLAYSARTGSARASELLARAPEPHARHLLDALAEQLRGDAPARRAALAALAPLVARRPLWLPRLPHHSLPRDLVRAARAELQPLPLLHALLALAALVPAAPALAAPLWPELLEALLRPAALHLPASPAAPAVRAHLHLAQLALFHALYATHPVTLVETLRGELAGAGPALREAWERELRPLLQSVRLHPALVTGSRNAEAEAARRLEEHEIVAETRRLALATPPPPPPSPGPAPPPPLGAPAPGPGRAVAALRPGAEPWFALLERCDADSAPHTPLPLEAEAGAGAPEPPEAAVEATPENTPAKEPRASFRFPSGESAAVRALGRRALSARASSPPRSPPPPPSEGRLARVLAERRALDSPVPFPPGGGGVPPAGALRVHPHRPTDIDQEVVQLTLGAPPPPGGREESPPLAPPRDPRRAGPRPPRAARRPPGPAPRRPASAGPSGARAASVAVQTVDTWPEPYEFLIADFYRAMEQPQHNPCERLDAYLEALYRGGGDGGGGDGGGGSSAPPSELAQQLALTHAQLVYERWRREAHAERNRRLLGRCRQARATDLHAQALRDRLRAVTAECEELKARLAARAAGAGDAGAGGAGEELARLEAALQGERAARARAEARLQQTALELAAARVSAQLGRGEQWEAARCGEALARAALLAERRAEHVRRLRQELLVLAERDHRLAEAPHAAPPPPGAPPLERALRAACARAEAEALSASTRADALAARAHELEAALAGRDALLGELKRAARLAAEEGAAKLHALQQRYHTLLRVLRAAEGRRLEALAAAPLGARAPPPPPPQEGDGEGDAPPDGS